MRLPARKKRRHAARRPPQVEGIRNPSITRRVVSPWAIIALYVLNISILVLIMMLFGYQSRFSDYLNQRGEFRDRQAHEQDQYMCDLIAQLHASPAGQLEELAHRLKCAKGPLPPRADGDNAATPSGVPIAPNGTNFTGTPTPGSQMPTGGARPTAAGRESATRDQGPSAGASRSSTPRSTAPPAATSPAAGGADPATVPIPSGIRLCIPFTTVCFG